MATNASASENVSWLLKETWSGGPTTRAFLDYNRSAFLSVFGLPVCAVCVVTSALSICLFCCDSTTPRTTRKILIVTSLVDVQFLFFSMFYLQPFIFCREGCAWRQFYKSLAYFLPIFALVDILESLRNYLVVLIAVEIFLVVCLPVRNKVGWSGKMTNYLIAASFGFYVFVRLPLISHLSIEDAGPEWSRVVPGLYQTDHADPADYSPCLQIGRSLKRPDHFRQEQQIGRVRRARERERESESE
ncbi:unnamed protein product [Schistocephalus solidus]|uniref:G_PROTEIN_RECEP_F1_2 domain-containing protein n=1 Tax=Schistocephalus solidus TaxID=70667 RepID=A0A183SMK7_SCHSO|nr:unnamed protein product [Schistocephalus solidus]